MEESDRLEREISRLVTAINKIDGAYYFCARRMSLRENTLALLYALHDGQPHTQKQIVEDWLIPKTTINTAVRELKREGYLALTPLPHSREKRSCSRRRAGSTLAECSPDFGRRSRRLCAIPLRSIRRSLLTPLTTLPSVSARRWRSAF